MTPGDAVRRRADEAACLWALTERQRGPVTFEQHLGAFVSGFLAGHAEGRAEGLAEAEQVFNEIYGHHIRTHYDGCEMNHRDCRFHRELARLGGK